MCWIINKVVYEKNHEKYHKVASEDKIVYKFGYVNNNIFHPSCYSEFGYEANVSNNKVDIKVLSFRNELEELYYLYAEEGYHSYSEECSLTLDEYAHDAFRIWANSKLNNCKRIFDYSREKFIAKFIIPKGTEYYENEVGEIVSSNIIWTGQIKDTSLVNDEPVKLKDIFIEP